MRVGIEVTWSAVTNGSTSVTATVEIWTENQYTYGDSQVLTYGGSISGTTSFTNNDGGTAQLRATKTYTYTYSTYGSSPGTRTFTASLSGAYNGVTPSESVTSSIPARPYAAPVAPSGVSVSRTSDTSLKISWTNNATAGKPWSNVWLQRSLNGGAWSTITTAIAGSATSYSHTGAAANQKCKYQVAADNTVGTSSYVATADIYTTPAVPGAPTRTNSGSSEIITWSNSGMGYSEYSTDIIAYKNGVSVGVIGTVATGIATFTHLTTNPVAAYTLTDKWKYTVRHKTTAGAQGTLYSAETAFTSETIGVTSPPNAPSALNPNGIIIDPSVVNTFSWTHNPTDASAQSSYELQWRLVGAGTWTNLGVINSTTPSHAFAINTFTDGTTVEWQVRNKGADAGWSPWAAPVTVSIALTPVLPDPVKVPLLLDLFTGKMEASFEANELRDYTARFQAQLTGGGTKDVDSNAISWSQRFISISMGRSAATFPNGHHDITNPYGHNITAKALTSNVATVTISGGIGGGPRIRAGDTITVLNVGAPFDGIWTAREVTWDGTSSGTVKYDCVGANVTNVASPGSVFSTIHGHGGAGNTVPGSGKITLSNWIALWYDMPYGWGTGDTPRKNGVVQVSSISLTSNVVTVNVPAPHYFAVGDRITLTGCGAPYDGVDRVITAVGGGWVKFALTNANIGSSNPVGALAKPSGKDTHFGNFHVMSYTADFVVPDTWVMLAMLNGDSGQVEWATGESGTGWTAVSFQNSWVNYGTYQGAQYRRVGDIVECRGLVKSGTVGSAIFTLPTGFRPPLDIILSGITSGLTTWSTGAVNSGTVAAHTHGNTGPGNIAARINVNTDGTVALQGGSNGFVDLSSIRFSVTP
jgi:hypothetical protein